MSAPHKLSDFSQPSHYQTTTQRSAPKQQQQHQNQFTAVEKRKYARCHSPAVCVDLTTAENGHPLPCAKRANQLNEIDVVMQLEADEWQLSDLEEIPMQDLFVAGDDFDLSAYLL